MAASSRNTALHTYVDDNGMSWNKAGLDGASNFATAVDGHAAAGAHPVWINTKRRQARTITYQDATTLRTYRPIFYTAATFAAVAIGDIIAVVIPGEVAAVNYAAIKKNPEKQPGSGASRHDAEHA
jgi:hypothetical protein